MADEAYYARTQDERAAAIEARFLTAFPPCGPVTGGTVVRLSLLKANLRNRLTVLFAGEGWVNVVPAFPDPKEPTFVVCVVSPPCVAPGTATIQLRVGDNSASGESLTQYKVRAISLHIACANV